MQKWSDGATPTVIELLGVTKRFYFDEHRAKSLRGWFIRHVFRKPVKKKPAGFVLRNINLEINRGEVVALVGQNGSGKSTMLRLIGGIYHSSEGSVAVNGRVAAIIELGAGFHGELTGAENAAIYASVLGLSRQELARHFEEIMDFSGIADFFDTPIKYYSSGMETRLAFAVAVCVKPDILLLDEVLSVGDQMFRERCFEHLRGFIAKGGTIVLVSHDRDLVRYLCSKAVWLEKGRIRMVSDVNTVMDAFEKSVNKDPFNNSCDDQSVL
jgi:ABC-type polysaccharide/polyol phosphate transport system ATPase subunit